ncbi:alpha/beta fold hydrolase [uncultured Draconibacterium sp.]|uniref:alpha/beta hydrolase n=1 Tax=uncultured Draconibacterium sp. TaxID=1573823 RepID=UPI0025EBF153|nr:alpha/beta fold hydrolase [uncultured Draconibacterium sp.]
MKNVNNIILLAIVLLIYSCQFVPKNPLDFGENDKYSIEAINCVNTESKNIYGVAYIPKGEQDQKYPLVILSHGYSSSHMFLTSYGTALAENGIACYTFDFCGGSNLSKSDGKTTEMSVLTEKDDLETVLAASKNWSFVDTLNIFLSGESQGGFVSALAAAECEEEIRGMVLLYPAFHMPDAMRNEFPDKQGIKDEMDFPNKMKIGRCYVDALYNMDAFEVTKNFDKEVLLIHGDKDKAVPLSYAERAAKEYPLATLKVIKGAGHVFIFKRHRNKAIKYFLEYINKQVSEK